MGIAVTRIYRHVVQEVLYVDTIVPEKLVDRRDIRCTEYGMRIAQLHAIRMVVRDTIEQYQPDDIVIEDCYLGSFAAAYEALVQVISVVTEEAYRYNPYNGIVKIPPSQVKTLLGVEGSSGDKDLVRIAVAPRLPDPEILNGLTEHAVDSLGVGIAYCIEPKAIM